MVPFESLGTVYYLHCIVTMVQSCIISEIKRDIGRKSLFSYPTAIDAPVRGPCRNKVWFGKSRMAWLPEGEKRFRICLLVSTQCTNVTDTRRTDRRRTTTADAALMQASRGKKDRSKLRSLARSDRLLERLQLRLSTRYLKRY